MDIPCRNEISVRLVGFLTLFFAKSAIAITAYLPLDVNFILKKIHFTLFYLLYLHIPTKLVKIKKNKIPLNKRDI